MGTQKPKGQKLHAVLSFIWIFQSLNIVSNCTVLRLLTSKFFKSWSEKVKIKQPDIWKVILIWGKYIKLWTILKYFNIYFRILVSFTMYEYHTTFPSSFSQFFFFLPRKSQKIMLWTLLTSLWGLNCKTSKNTFE